MTGTLLKKNADVITANKDGLTALHIAVMAGQTETVKALLEQGADISATDPIYGFTALRMAAVMGHTEIVKALLEQGVNVNTMDEDGITALRAAAGTGRTETVKALLEQGVNVNTMDEDGITALHTAAMAGQTETVKLLLEKGADPTATNKNGLTALHAAAAKGYAEVEKYLKQYVVIEHRNTDEILKNKLGYHDEVIKMNKYGIYNGDKGHDTFVVYPTYDGRKEGYYLVIGDLNYGQVIDYIDISQFGSIKNKEDIKFVEVQFNGNTAIDMRSKGGASMVLLLGKTKEDIESIQDCIISPHLQTHTDL